MGCETVNPHVRAQGRLWRALGGMEGVMFPPVPDRTLKGTSAHFLPHPDSSSPDSILPKRNTSFLWNKAIQESMELGGSFDQDTFFHMHRHLLAESDQSTELEKSLYERRRGIAGTYSSLESKTHSEFTSAHETQLYAGMTTPYDELTYEETLFEVKVDGEKALNTEKGESSLPQTSEEENALRNFLKQRKADTMSSLISVKHEAMNMQPEMQVLSNKKEEKSYSKKTGFSRRNSSLIGNAVMERPHLKFRSGSIRSGHHHHHRSADKEQISDGMLSEGLIKSYIEERIRAVERQIRQEVAEEAHILKKHSRPKPKTPFPDMSSANIPESGPSDASSKEFILREIAAVLAAKGYLPRVQAQNQDILQYSDNSLGKAVQQKAQFDRNDSARMSHSKLSKIQRHKLASPRGSPQRIRRVSQNSVNSTYKSHKDTQRESTLKSGQTSPKSKHSSRFSMNSVKEITELKRRKRKSNGSRSSLTSLLRTQESSSSDTDAVTMRSRQQSIASKKTTKSKLSFNNSLPNQKQALNTSSGYFVSEQPDTGHGNDFIIDEMPSIELQEKEVTYKMADHTMPVQVPMQQDSMETLTAAPSTSKQVENDEMPAPSVVPRSQRRVPPPRPPAPSLPIYQSISQAGSSTNYQHGTPQPLPATNIVPTIVPPKGPPPPVPQRPKKFISKVPSKAEITTRESQITTKPAMKITGKTTENPIYFSRKESSTDPQGPSDKTLTSQITNGTVSTFLSNSTQQTTIQEEDEAAVGKAKQPNKELNAGTPGRSSRENQAGSQRDSRTGSPQQSSPARQSLGRSSATSQHNEDRSETDYFLMDDHTAGITL
ncbi:hypothetical protein SK128_019608 [Halocaridina rubra]|uniref:Uncharacterized protein n=1 Tax=Halocaridina rubra TaxID=373956 RepID=A0AAN8XVF0_HALRR